jgi:hypothetical protein
LPDGRTRLIAKGPDFTPILVDKLAIKVTKEGKFVRDLPLAAHLNAMLKSELFLKHFRPLDQVVRTPIYLRDFLLVQPGYNDDGPGQRVLYLGPEPQITDSTETINRFLDVMAWASNADRTNAVAAAITMLLSNHWHGGKPLVLVTATKSHAGKGTVTEFIRGRAAKADLLYENLDWPIQSQFQNQVKADPEIRMVLFDNVRLDSAGVKNRFIRSGFVESFVTNEKVTLASPGDGDPIKLVNKYVVVINTNEGNLSPDLLNRALPIHLAPTGNLHDRVSPIGNPKLDFLPQNAQQIEAEILGMIQRWLAAGRPLDETVRYPMTPWAKTVGGILKVNGFTDFLANFAIRQTADNPIRQALGILAEEKPGKSLRPADWAQLAVDQGVAKMLFSPNERDTEKGRERAIGIIMKGHLEETFEVSSETGPFRVRLEGGNRRWTKGENPHVRYVFTILEDEAVQIAQQEDAGQAKESSEKTSSS